MNQTDLLKRIAELENKVTYLLETKKIGKFKQLLKVILENKFLYISLGICLILTPLAVYAAMEVPHFFEKGMVISSSEMNANFAEIESKIDEIETGTAVWNKDDLTGNLRYMEGNIGLGVNNPQDKLEVAGNVEAEGFSINGVTIGTSSGSYWSETPPYLYYLTNNDIGIGTAQPVGKFQIDVKADSVCDGSSCSGLTGDDFVIDSDGNVGRQQQCKLFGRRNSN